MEGLIPGSGSSPGGGNGNPLQYSCMGNPWTEEPGRLQSLRLQRVKHNWRDWARASCQEICRMLLFHFHKNFWNSMFSSILQMWKLRLRVKAYAQGQKIITGGVRISVWICFIPGLCSQRLSVLLRGAHSSTNPIPGPQQYFPSKVWSFLRALQGSYGLWRGISGHWPGLRLLSTSHHHLLFKDIILTL